MPQCDWAGVELRRVCAKTPSFRGSLTGSEGLTVSFLGAVTHFDEFRRCAKDGQIAIF